ncbi:MAG: Gfo/Idh/MocA family protein [Candidatus Hydrogenedentota bacterium]
MKTTRRQFFGMAGGAALAATALGSKAVAANDRIQVAGVGLRGQGWGLVRRAQQCKLAEVVALCDVDRKVLDKRAKELEELTGKQPKTYTDMRDLYENEGIDAVTIATPNHWHVLAAIWAMQAGKDVYCEKPISHTIFEGRQLVNAQQQTGRVLQHGTQRRSHAEWQRAVERAKNGVIGDIYMARSMITRRRDAFAYPMAEEAPTHLDWKLWQGPATEQPFSRNYVHYNWHWFWHYGNGEIGNNGPHRTDIVNWVFDKGLPTEISSTGGIFGYDEDARETPNTHVTHYTFADGAIYTMEVRNRPTEGGPFVALYGSKGYSKDTTFFDPDDNEIEDENPPTASPDYSMSHMLGFLKAVQAQDPAAVPANAEQGHVAAALCHLGNIAYRTGRKLRFDPKTETFEGDEEANALLTRAYRKGFEVPDLG